jgi:hypothetical protein
LEQDWGSKTSPAYQQQRELAKRAMVSLGLDEQAIDAMEGVVGFSKVMKAFAKIGKGSAEPTAHGLEGGGQGGFSMTPEQAKARKSQLMADADWRGRAMKSNSSEFAEITKLNKIITGN